MNIINNVYLVGIIIIPMLLYLFEMVEIYQCAYVGLKLKKDKRIINLISLCSKLGIQHYINICRKNSNILSGNVFIF